MSLPATEPLTPNRPMPRCRMNFFISDNRMLRSIQLEMIVAAIVLLPAIVHAGNQPLCPFALSWNSTLSNWASTAPWIKVLLKGGLANAKNLGCKVFYRPYEIPGHDDGALPSDKTGAQMASQVLSLLNTVPQASWPDAIGYRNEFDGGTWSATQFIDYYDTLRAGGYTGIIVYGSYGPGGPPDMSIFGIASEQAAINKADAIEAHEYFDLTVKYKSWDSYTTHRHVREMNQYPYLKNKPWFIGEFGSDACPFQDRQDPCLRRGWQDTGTTAGCTAAKLTAAAYQTQLEIYRWGDSANGVLAVADNVVSVFIFGQAGSTWKDFEVLGTPVADYLQTTWTRTPGAISGWVRDINNSPLAGAVVTSNVGPHAGPGPYSATTDANGNYTLTHVEPWTYSLTVSRSGYETLSRTPVSVRYATTTSSNFNLRSAGSISGFISTSNGGPIVEALVSTNSGGYSTTSAADGSYTLSNVAIGTYSVMASKAAYVNQTKSGIVVTTGQTTPCNFVMQPVLSNLATQAVTFQTCGRASTSQTGLQAMDGNVSSTKWRCAHNGDTVPGDHWLAYDLGSIASVTQFVIKNVSLMGEPAGAPGTWDTRAFLIESGPSLRGPWTQEFSVSNNTQSTCTLNYPTAKALRYVRLRVTQPTQDISSWSVRIPEFEVWGLAGTSAPIRFDAEDYDGGANAAEGLDYHDTTAGNSGNQYRTQDVDIETCIDGTFDVYNTAAGEWLKYPLRSGGKFTFQVYHAGTTGGNCHLEIDGANVTGLLNMPATGGDQTWAKFNGPAFTIPAGNHALKLVEDTGGYRLNCFILTPYTPIPGDFDKDGDVDMVDFSHFQVCLTGPGFTQDNPSCLDANLDNDDDVDQNDFVIFQRCMRGSEAPADPDCGSS